MKSVLWCVYVCGGVFRGIHTINCFFHSSFYFLFRVWYCCVTTNILGSILSKPMRFFFLFFFFFKSDAVSENIPNTVCAKLV